MALINKNIWLAFKLVTIIWALSLGISTYSTYQHVYDEFVIEQSSLTIMSKNSLNATFEQYEVLLHIVAAQILKDDQVIDKKEIQSIMKVATDLDLSVSAFGVFNLDGTVYASHPMNPISKEGSLVNIPQARPSFKESINKQTMVVGRTYYNKNLNTIIVPFRLTVRDSTGAARFILSIAVSIEKGFSFFVNNANTSGLYNTFLYRDTDRYFQLAPMNSINEPSIYQYQIPQEDITQAIAKLETQLDTPFIELKEQERIIINENSHPARQALDVSIYLKKYSLWLVTETKLNDIRDAFIEKVSLLTLLHFIAIVLIYILFKNIATSEKKKAIALEYQASHDYLTQLWNRYYYDRYLESINHNKSYALIYLDIDHFKTVNDSHGYAIGDRLLKEVASRVKSIAGKKDVVIRASSDEFILICFHDSHQQTVKICDKLLTSFNQSFLIGNFDIKLSASIGVSTYPDKSANSNDIKRDAGLAMNKAKAKRNSIVFFDDTLLQDYVYQCNVEQALSKAVINEELYMLYQPQFSASGTVIGVEALIRWQNDVLGFMPPDKFIPIAESMGWMDEIGAFVIERSLSEMLLLQKETGYTFSVSVNVSVKQFKNGHFFEQLINSIKKINFPTELLILEVTESVLIDDIAKMQTLMEKIKAQNIRISLDDFGTGYSSLSILNNLPIDELKIDRSFVIDIIEKVDTKAMIDTIITLANNKQIKTVAEGVESDAMFDALKALGCDIYQGYYFSKPIDSKQLTELIKTRNTKS